MATSSSKLPLIAAGAIGLGLLLWRGKNAVDEAQGAAQEEDPDYVAEPEIVEDDVADQMPAQAQQYADVIKRVASEQGIDPLLITAIGWRESKWGTTSALDVLGAEGTGDFRVRSTAWVNKNKPPNVMSVGGLYGKWYAPKGWQPPFWVPADSRGWGRGLMQIDYAASQLINWADPYENITAGAKIWKAKRSYIVNHVPGLSDADYDKAATAAYNTGEGNVTKSLLAGLDPDTTTEKGNYSADVFNNMNNWRAA